MSVAFRARLEPLDPPCGDGVTTEFKTSTGYSPGSFTGIVRGLPRVADNCDGYIETDPAAGCVTFREPPLPGDTVMGHWLEELPDDFGVVEQQLDISLQLESGIQVGLEIEQAVSLVLEAQGEIVLALSSEQGIQLVVEQEEEIVLTVENCDE